MFVSISALAAVVVLWPMLSTAIAAQTSALLPAVGSSQSYVVTTTFKGPQPKEGGAPPNQTGRLTVSRTDLKTIRISFQSDSGNLQGTATIADANIFDQDSLYGPYVATYDNALVTAAGAGRTIGDRRIVSVALSPPMPPPGAMPPPPPGGFGQTRDGGPGSGFRVDVPPPQKLTLIVRVVSVSGSTHKLTGTGTATQTMPTPKGDAQVTVTMNVDETVAGGRVAYYNETVEHAIAGRQGRIILTSTTTLEAVRTKLGQRLSQRAQAI